MMPPAAVPRPRRPPEEDSRQKENPSQAPPPAPKKVCSNPNCTNPKPIEIDGERVCETCGSIISEDHIVAEVTFGETSAGAAVVQGAYIGEGQRHARTLGAAINRKVGGGLTSREQTHSHFQQEIRRIASSLGLQQSVRDGAFNFMKLALINNFTYGRPTSTVAAVALYLACRTDRENNTLLMDLAEAVKTNVYKLGQTYRELAKMLYMDGGVRKDDVTPFVEVERLILKYARRLEFGVHTYKVAEDAAKIIKRMKRDWMLTGRRPAGLCGAGLVLAARMNNFRRTVREVVYVVKVADMTIAKRIDEFDRTTSGALTVDQFRQYGPSLKIAHDPPVLFETKVKEEKEREKKARKRTTSLLAEMEDEGREPSSSWDRVLLGRPSKRRSVSASSSRPTTVTPAPTQEPRRDAEGFAIPAIPVDPRLTNEPASNSSARPSQPGSSAGSTLAPQSSGRSRKRRNTEDAQNTQESTPADESGSEYTSGTLTREGTAEESVETGRRRKKRRKNRDRPAQVHITAEDVAGEEELENEINRHLHDADFIESMEEVKFLKYEDNAKRLARSLQPPSATRPFSMSETIDASEFADDPEVANCLLSEAEIAIKERIWVTHNEDWLRAQQDRLLKKALAEASGKQREKKTRKKRTYRRGDGSSARDGATPAEDPAEASQRMLNRYGQKGFSRHINYERLNQIYRGSGKRSSGAGSGSQTSGSPTATVTTPVTTPVESEAGSEAGSPRTSRAGSIAGSVAGSVVSTSPAPPGDNTHGRNPAGQEAQAAGGAQEQVMVISDDEEIDGDLGDLDDDPMDDDDDDVESVARSAGIGMGGDMDDFSQYGGDEYDMTDME